MSDNLNPGLHSLTVIIAIATAALLLAGAFTKLVDRAEQLGNQMAANQNAVLQQIK